MRTSEIMMILSLVAVLIFFAVAPHVSSSSNGHDLTSLSEEAFVGLAHVYRSGGEAPDLVAKLNEALGMIQAANLQRAEGNSTKANALEWEAQSLLTQVINNTPLAQQQATVNSMTRTVSELGWIPTIVVLLTASFYCGLRIWRNYERMKLFEMEILGEKIAD